MRNSNNNYNNYIINNDNILNNMEIIYKQINSMENIFNSFKIQTLKIKEQMMEIGKKTIK